jgi:hypothetical protein
LAPSHIFVFLALNGFFFDVLVEVFPSKPQLIFMLSGMEDGLVEFFDLQPAACVGVYRDGVDGWSLLRHPQNCTAATGSERKHYLFR